jgi:hypothetical protein
LRGVPVVADLIHTIVWLLEALRFWRVSEKQAPATGLACHDERADLYHERNITYWYLRPPS